MRTRDTLAWLVASAAVLAMIGSVLLLGRGGWAPLDVPPAVEAAPEVVLPEPSAPEPSAPDPEPEPASEPYGIERAVPLRVRIGAITVDAPIVRVGLEVDGSMEIPERVAEIGWYDPDERGVAPGAAGTAVLAGHVDSRTQGRGALYDLRDLRVGEIIELDLTDGRMQRWRITELIQYPKDVLPFLELFVWTGPPRLAVITCGGEFDRTSRSYTDNIVVYAEPYDGQLDGSDSSPAPAA